MKEDNVKNKAVKIVILKSKKIFVYIGIFSFFANILLLVSPIYMMQLYDRVLGSQNVDTLVVLSLIMGYLYLFYTLVEMIRAKLLIKLGLNFDRYLSKKTLSAMFRQKVLSNGLVVGNGVREVETIKQFFSSQAIFSFFDLPFTPFFIIINFFLHPFLGVISVLAAIILFILAIITELSARDLLKKSNDLSGQAYYFIDSSLKNYEALEAMGMFEGIENKWERKHQPRVALQSQANDRLTSLAAVTKAFRLFIQSAILGVGAYLAIIGVCSPGVMIAASIILGKALQPVEQSIASWRGFVAARNSYHALNKILEVVESDEGEKLTLPNPVGRLEVNALFISVQIPGSLQLLPIIRGVQFNLNSGETLGIIGKSGSGKSTLGRALIGITKPTGGSVNLDGVKVFQWDKSELGPHIGYVPQSIEIFQGTVTENIARFSNEVNDEKVVEAAKISGCHEMILKLQKGYDTEIGSGNILSGGQRQLIAIARALYNNPKYILFDEPNSNLDSSGEESLLKAIKYLKENKITTVIVVHNTKFLESVDKILVLSEGQQVAFGGREEVLAKLRPKRQNPEPPSASSGSSFIINPKT